MKRSTQVGIPVGMLIFFSWLYSTSMGAVVAQRLDDPSYVAFEAEDYYDITTTGSNQWIVVSTASPITSPVGLDVIPADSDVSGGAALLADFSIGFHESTVTYRIAFAYPGDYQFYVRYSMYEHSSIGSGYGNEDSFYRPPDFNAVPDDDVVSGFSSTNVEGVHGWKNTGAVYEVTAAHVADGYVDFMIDSRERGFSIDRIVFTTTSLSDAELDGLLNWDIVKSHFTDGDSADSNWSTTSNWNSGVPDVMTAAFIGDEKTAQLSAAGAEAYQLTIGHTESTLPGNGTLNQTADSLTVAKGLSIGINADADGEAHIEGTYTATGGSTLTVGQPATGRTNLYLGHNSAGTDYDATGTLDLSGAAQFDAYLDNLVLGEVTSGSARGRGAGILKLAETNNIDATQIVISTSSMHAAPQLWSSVELGDENNIQTDLLVVGGRRSRATLEFAAPGGTLNLTGSSGAAADLRIAYTDLNTGSLGNATMDLSGGTFNATLNDVVVAYHMSKGGTDTGTLTFDDGTVNAQSLTIGWAGSHSTEGKGKAVGTVNMGGGSLTTTTAVLGTGEGTTTGTLNLSGGTFTSGSLVVGHGLVHAGTGDGAGTGTVNISDGTAQINGNVTLGTGTAASSGTINLTGGAMNVTGNVTGGVGTSSVNVDGGELDVTGDLRVDSLRVGFNGRTASALVSGGVVVDGTGTLYVGYRNSASVNPSNQTQGMLDLSVADSVTLNTSTMTVGLLSAEVNTLTEGTLRLSAEGVNNISATTITIGDSTAGVSPTVRGFLVLGEDNTIRTDALYLGRRKAQGTMSIAAGGTLDLAGLSGAKANLYIGYCDTTTTATINQGTMNLVGGTLDAALGELVIGYHRYPWSSPTSGRGMGTLSFDAGSVTADTVTIGAGSSDYNEEYGFREGRGVGALNMGGGTFETQSISLAEGSSRTEGTFNLTGGTLTVTGSVVGGIGTSALNVDGGTMTIGGDLIANTVRVGYESRTASLSIGTSGAGTVEIGSGSENLFIGRRVSNINIDTVGTLDVSDAASFSADVGTLVIGSLTNNSGTGNVTGTLKLAAESAIDADVVRLGYIDGGNVRPVTGNLELGEQTTVGTDTLIVGDHKGIGNISFPDGGTLTLGGKSGQKADLRIGDNSDSNTSSTATGTMNLSGGVFVANLGQLVLGDYASDMADPGGFGSGSASGTLTLSDSALNSIQVDSVLLGNYARDGSGGSGTTKTASGTITMSGGTFNVAGDVTRGVNYGAANGAITRSTVNVDGGTMTVGGDLIVDTLRVGAGALVGELTVSGGGTVEIGTPAYRTNLYIARTTTDIANNPKSTVDFSGAGQLTAYLNAFNIGERTGGHTSTSGKPIAEVILAPTTLIDAASILISEYDMWDANAQQTRMRLGADTTIRTDTFTIAGSRGNALVDFHTGGTFTLEGSSGVAADLRVGYCTLGTTNSTDGILNLNGGTFNATLDNLIVGYRVYRGEYDVTTNAAMSFDAGTVTANSVTLGWGTQPTSNDGTMGIGIGTLNMRGGALTTGAIQLGVGTTKSEGTLSLTGGTLAAGSITKGVGTAAFNWTDGTLHVGTFGSEDQRLDLVQDGGTLAPGNSPGMTTVHGHYAMNAGAIEIEINGYDQGDQGLVGDAHDGIGYDFVKVHGDATLAGSLNVLLLDGFLPDLGTHFDVLQTTGALDIEGLTLSHNWPGSGFGWWNVSSIPSGDGFLLRLSAVPEPTGALLALLALTGLLGCIRPRRLRSDA